MATFNFKSLQEIAEYCDSRAREKEQRMAKSLENGGSKRTQFYQQTWGECVAFYELAGILRDAEINEG